MLRTQGLQTRTRTTEVPRLSSSVGGLWHVARTKTWLWLGQPAVIQDPWPLSLGLDTQIPSETVISTCFANQTKAAKKLWNYTTKPRHKEKVNFLP